MKRGWVAVYQGPQRDAGEVVTALQVQGIKTEVLEQPRFGAFAASYLDARVYVPVGELRRSRELLRRNPRWKPVGEAAELREVQRDYRIFVIAGAALAVLAAALIAGVLIFQR